MCINSRLVEPEASWEDLKLPQSVVDELKEVCRYARRTKLAGVSVLFLGPSSTGKIMAAEVIAGELGLLLYIIDLSSVVSKYVGETEENLARVFSAAEDGGAVLFFDEADALLGKRTEVRDAHDRFANIEGAYLLQRLEDYTGIAILATCRRDDIDEAFVRRFQIAVDFPMPDRSARKRIWSCLFRR